MGVALLRVLTLDGLVPGIEELRGTFDWIDSDVRQGKRVLINRVSRLGGRERWSCVGCEGKSGNQIRQSARFVAGVPNGRLQRRFRGQPWLLPAADDSCSAEILGRARSDALIKRSRRNKWTLLAGEGSRKTDLVQELNGPAR